MVVTLSGIVRLVRPVYWVERHVPHASSTTLLGIVMLARLPQPE